MNKITDVNKVELKYKRPNRDELIHVPNPDVAIKYLRTIIDDGVLDLKEHCWLILMTSDNYLLGISEIGMGSIDNVKISLRNIVQTTLVANAVRIVLVHNHTSGDLTFSRADITTARHIRDTAIMMGIDLQDSLIITSEKYSSIRDLLSDWE
ncbi:hypothetical protein GCM10011344_27100 [Dokdonia pacifica]|uniref:RadC-like JAB domain-containing protein n=1 Tax=Dokdonia pacifica TaxID=1627892 RepID=A0A239E7C3_9FLAO|nr:JAB domain-containing protein [Dokdonia pacifica]GGG25029.1 hypothetical protein GCM10011344_27100 [Dokdonia pacifica]SNS40341.1 RadC-like JAB domain-containing protein [Dokdonia pacifica]